MGKKRKSIIFLPAASTFYKNSHTINNLAQTKLTKFPNVKPTQNSICILFYSYT